MTVHAKVLFVLLLILPAAYSATYYVSSTGNDAAPGTMAAPFRSIAKVNTLTLRSGDAVYFRGGDTFNGSISIDSSDIGSAATPIIIGSFASGRAAINGGNGKGITVFDTVGVRITNITVIGNGRKTGNTEDGIIVNNSRAVDVVHCEVYGFQHSGVRLYDSDAIRLYGVYSHDNGFAGIYSINPSMTVPSGWNSGLYIGYCITANNPGDPTVLNNHSGNGIVISCFRDVLIEYCESYTNGWDMPWTGNGPVGIWTFCVDRATIQYCISHDNRTGPYSTKDGGGFDLDGGTRNSVIQYCLSYNNDGTGYGIFQYSGAPDFFSNTIRYCVGYNDGKKVGAGGIRVWNGPNTVSTFHDVTVHNNTIYNTKSAAVYFINPIGNGRFINNIFITKGAPFIGTSATAASHTLRYNNYWDLDGRFEQDGYSNFSEWALAKNVEQHAGSIVGRFGDPKLQCIAVPPTVTDPALLSAYTNAIPLSVSPVIDAGCDLLSMFGLPMGSRDLLGNAVPRNRVFDIGACEYISSLPPAAPVVSGVPASFTTNAPFTVMLDVDRNFGYWSTNGSAFTQFTAAGTSITIDRTTTLRC
ncbi:MAG: right-handed parallel beta-helix repeat-containing protein [Spirochaetes bacterium]|nr:right-handed parallel beta-helix repeat-containing protein [Spirochaetota bacterium]